MIPADEQNIRRTRLQWPPYMRITSFVSCWRAGQDESMAMWDLYGRARGSVAIKSTIGNLKKCAISANRKIFIGEVKYVELDKAVWDNNLIAMCVRKVLSYRHECEIRLLIWLAQEQGALPPEIDGTQEEGVRELKKLLPPGIRVAIDLQNTITEIMVGPREPEWVGHLIAKILKRYNLPQKVRMSTLLKARV
jgi:hypothetical protein